MKNNKMEEGKIYHLPITIYYEDTDHSGVVYHPNYLKYFERARENVIGTDMLVQLWKEKRIGFAVYKADLTYYEGVEFGETIDVRSSYKLDGKFRVVWSQEVWREGAEKPAVSCELHLVCLDADKKLIPIPEEAG